MSLLIQKEANKSQSGILIEKEQPTKPTRAYSLKQEKAVAESVNGSRTLNSGATPFQKGDVKTEQFVLECKTKTSHSESMSIKKAWLEKNKEEALFMGKPYNALAFNFGPDEQNYYIIDEYLFQELLEYLQNKTV